MFSLAIIKDSVKLSPNKLRHDFVQAIILVLNQKYCNRVILNVGLSISVFDILEAGDPYVHSGEASAFVKVKFRLIVFRPFVGEILEGTIRSSSEEGIHVSLGFFEDILIPPTCMQPETIFDPAEQVWAWNYEENKMFLDNGEQIRFRVLSEHWEETAPLQKDALMAARAATLSGTIVDGGNEESIPTPSAPFKLSASIAEDGLGLIRWWQSLPEQDDDDRGE